MNTIKLQDSFMMSDKFGDKSQGLFVRTKIIGGHGRYTDDKGISQLGEVIFEESNMVLIGGVQYAMEQLFKVKGSVNTGYLNERHGIGCQTNNINAPQGLPYPPTHAICLFGVGTGGAAENNSTVFDVKYRERDIVDMIPFRLTNDPLPASDLNKYYGKKKIDNTTAYYLKRFDAEPEIRHLWKDGEEGEDGSIVDSDVYSSGRPEDVESFTEILLTISKKDIKQWFSVNGGIEESRVNSVALFAAVFNSSEGDYEKIKAFSKLNIPTERLSLAKDLEIIYRVYGS